MVLAMMSFKPERTNANEESPEITTVSGIEIEDETIGQAGTEPLVGIDVVKVNYAVKIADTGAKVDSAKFFVFGSGGEVVELENLIKIGTSTYHQKNRNTQILHSCCFRVKDPHCKTDETNERPPHPKYHFVLVCDYLRVLEFAFLVSLDCFQRVLGSHLQTQVLPVLGCALLHQLWVWVDEGIDTFSF